MKILAAADLHGNKKYIRNLVKKSKTVDLIIIAGDISSYKVTTKEAIMELKKSKKPILAINGNHETIKEIKTDKQVTNLHKKIKTIDNFNFIGYGSGIFLRKDRELEEFSKKINKKNIIFITHAPPYKTKLDKMPMENVGSVSIRKFIEKHKPILFICGHLHENENKRQKLKQTLMINPGYKGEIIEI